MADITGLLGPEIPRLRRYALALSHEKAKADDLVQSCLVRAIAKQHLWQEGTDLRAWLFTILHNHHVNEVRHIARELPAVPLENLSASLAVKEKATDALQLRDLYRAIARLPDSQRQVILLVGLEGMNYEQVAQILHIPIGTVRSRLSRGRDTLRVQMSLEKQTSVRESRTASRRATSITRRAA